MGGTSSDSDAQRTLDAARKWLGGIAGAIVLGIISWNFQHVLSDGDRLTKLETAEPKDVDALKTGQAMRYTSQDAERDRQENDARFSAIERRLEKLDGDPVKRPKPRARAGNGQ